MQNRPVWVAFLLTCFLLTGLVGLFASYAGAIPLERALFRSETLDRAATVGELDPAAIRRQFGPAVADAMAGPGDLVTRLARAHEAIRQEGREESSSVAGRSRLMLGVVTVLAGALGAGLLLLASRPPPG